MSIVLNSSYIKDFLKEEEFEEILPMVETAHNLLKNKNGAGNSYLGWVDLPKNYDVSEFERIKSAADKIKKDSKILIVIGIGGSYLGARAIIEAVSGLFHNETKTNVPRVYFLGNNISPTYINKIISICENVDFSINVISKSGTTTEPAIAFRIFKNILEKKYGEKEARSRIYCTTDRRVGNLKALADKNGYETFTIPDDVGGRFSVLTAVGLLPIAVCDLNIDLLMNGALKAMEDFSVCDIEKNSCYRYAAIRNILYRKGKVIELLASYLPELSIFGEWFKQLFGESEGKANKGIFPASAIFSTDLHSLGQYIQDGLKILFETIINIKKPSKDYYIEQVEDNFDGLNYLADQNISSIVQNVLKATVLAHTKGGVPNIIIEMEKLEEFELGYLIYFFEKACAISGYILGVNPFNQPGVESYKKNMFALLGKPGFEEERKKLLKEI